VTSSKDISNVVVYLDGSKAVKFDDMKVGSVWSYSSDTMIAKVKVKSGCTEQVFDNDYCDALPITWAYINLDGLNLSFGTYSEIDNEKFTIYGIKADLNKCILGTVLGNGTTVKMSDYLFTMPDMYLYAIIKQTDYDGTEDWSKVIVNKAKLNKLKQDGTAYDIIGRQIR